MANTSAPISNESAASPERYDLLRVLERPGHEIYVCEPGEPREELAWIEGELRAATGRGR